MIRSRQSSLSPDERSTVLLISAGFSLALAGTSAALLYKSHSLANKSRRRGKKRSLEELVRPNILELTPYRCARDDYSTGILLDANENTHGAALPQHTLEFDTSTLELNRYPDPYQLSVKTLLGNLRGVKPEQIFVGVGSDEAIDLLIRIFCAPGQDSILTTPPTYGMYKVCAKVNDVAVQTCPLSPEFHVEVPALLRAVTESTKIVFLCSPGNPTAVSIPLDTVRAVHAGFDGIVVVDEAYVDFSQSPSACTLVNELDRVVVLQTLSKAFGMAGIRMGMAYAHRDIIQLMNNVKAPYNVNKLSEEVAKIALSDTTLCRTRVKQILCEREKLMSTLAAEPYVRRVLPSDANFFLVELAHAHTIYLHMAEHGVVVRFRGTELHCKDCLRVTVGTEEENEQLLALLRSTVRAVESGEIAIRD